MFNEKELINIRWNNTNREWYEARGYKYTKRNDEFQIFAKDLSPKSTQTITAICDYCGDEFNTQFALYQNAINNIYSNKCACKKCVGKKISEVRLLKERECVFEQLKQVCMDNEYVLLTDKYEYTGKKMQIEFLCPKHGKQNMMLDNLLRGHKCIDCSYETRFIKIKKSTSEVRKGIESINNNEWLNPLEFKNVLTPNIKIKCGLCGKNTFIVSYANYIRNGVNKCRSCSKKESIGERIIREYLNDHNIPYVSEKRFVDCKDKRTLPFDFYLSGYHALIEFDGEQHYYDVYGDGSIEKVKHRDQIKNVYCKNNNIPLLRIPYWYRNNLAGFIELLNDFINQLKMIQVEDIV